VIINILKFYLSDFKLSLDFMVKPLIYEAIEQYQHQLSIYMHLKQLTRWLIFVIFQTKQFRFPADFEIIKCLKQFSVKGIRYSSKYQGL